MSHANSESCEIEYVSKAEWPEATAPFLDNTYRHCAAYADRFAARQGADSEYIAVRNASRIVGAANVRIKKVPVLGGGIAYIGRGPLTHLDSESDRANLSATLAVLRAEYVNKRNLVLRIQTSLGSPDWDAMVEDVFTESGFQTTDRAHTYRTFLLDISPPLDEIRKALKKKWRYELTRSQKVAVETRFVTDSEAYGRFQSIFNEFVAAKGFEADPDADFLAPVQEALGETEKFRIGLAEIDGRIVSAGLWGMLGDTVVWVLGASTPEGLEARAAYLLQWETIALAKESGMKWYDLGGINPEANPGVYHFKKGLGGLDRTTPGPYEVAPDSLKGKLALKSEEFYKKLRERP